MEKSRPLYHFLKRLIDIVFSMFALVLFSPFWMLIVCAIRLDSKGPAIFSHERVGKTGKIFTIHKFRTMHVTAKPSDFSPKKPNDPRLTKVGNRLRKTGLDEFPQFWNVLRGEMSIVGPRPEMPFIVEKYTKQQRKRLNVKPGITGLWQIHGRKDLPLHEDIGYDFKYIQNQSLLLDFVIMVKTVGVVLRGAGSH